MGLYAPGIRLEAEWSATHDKWETTRTIAMRMPTTSLSAHSVRRQQSLRTLRMPSRISRPSLRTTGNPSAAKIHLQHKDGWKERGAAQRETLFNGQKIRLRIMSPLYRQR